MDPIKQRPNEDSKNTRTQGPIGVTRFNFWPRPIMLFSSSWGPSICSLCVWCASKDGLNSKWLLALRILAVPCDHVLFELELSWVFWISVIFCTRCGSILVYKQWNGYWILCVQEKCMIYTYIQHNMFKQNLTVVGPKSPYPFRVRKCLKAGCGGLKPFLRAQSSTDEATYKNDSHPHLLDCLPQ